MIKVALMFQKGKYIVREYEDEKELRVRDVSKEIGEFTYVDDAVDCLADTFQYNEFVLKLVGFKT